MTNTYTHTTTDWLLLAVVSGIIGFLVTEFIRDSRCYKEYKEWRRSRRRS